MADHLIRRFPKTREIVDKASQLVGHDLERVRQRGPDQELIVPSVLEPLLTAIQIAYVKWLQSLGSSPNACAGYSAGETAAYFAAGILTEDDAIRVAAIRGRSLDHEMDENASMISVARVSITWVHRIIDDFRGHVELAAINAEDHSTIVGTREEMKNFRIRASIHGGVVSDVLVAGPWHSRRLVTTAEQIQAQLESIHFNPPSIPLCLGSTGEVERDPARLRRALAFNVASLIHWSKVMDSLRGQSINEFVEMGPGHTLKGIARYWNPNIHSYRVHCVESSTGRLVPVPHYNQPIVHRSSSHEQA